MNQGLKCTAHIPGFEHGDVILKKIINEVENKADARILKSIFDLSLDMICIADLAGNFKKISRSFEHTLGYSQKELLSRPYKDFVVEDDRAKTEAVNESLRGGFPVLNFENRYRCKDGSIRWFSWKSSQPTNGNLIYAIARDITDQKIAGEKFNEYSEQLEVFKNENLQSMRYASTIQEAIMQDKDSLKQLFPESLIFFSPKNIVSGDFFWFDQKNDKLFAAVGDCTGHGVPGALLTIMGLNIINNIFNTEKTVTPSVLMKGIDQRLDRMLSRKDGRKVLNDGMDVAMYCVDLDKMELEFCAVNNSIYILRNGNLLELKSEKYSIGSNIAGQDFVAQKIPIQKGDVIYMSTDGLIDQFGGKDGKKYSKKRFKELLLLIQDKPMNEQKIIISKVFEIWKGNQEQTDDVLVMGVKI